MANSELESPALDLSTAITESSDAGSCSEVLPERRKEIANIARDSQDSVPISVSKQSAKIATFASKDASLQVESNHGTVVGTQFIRGNAYFYNQTDSTSFFAPLNLTFLSSDKYILSQKSKKAIHQAGKLSPDRHMQNLALTQGPYVPHAVVDSAFVRQRLSKIAECFSFIDRGFAEFFKVVIRACERSLMDDMLRNARETISQRQSGDVHYLGDLGEYCERVNDVWQSSPSDIAETQYAFTHTRDQVFGYLQDAYEIHYWSLMADLFLEEMSNSVKRNQSMNVVMRVLDSLRHELRRQLARLAEAKGHNVPEPIEYGINARMRLLDGILETAYMEDPEYVPKMSHQAAAPDMEVASEQAASIAVPVLQVEKQQTELEKVSLMTLFLVFIAVALIPGSVAFSKSINIEPPEAGIGSTSDNGFWWLIQGNLVAILGNLLSAVPLLKVTRRSAAYYAMWAFLFLSTAFGIVSVAIYPFKNGAWSSLCGFFCSFFAVGSVLVLTQAVGKKADTPSSAQRKAKTE